MNNRTLIQLKKKILQEALGKPTMSYQKFHQETSLQRLLNHSEGQQNINLKEYSRLEKIILNKAESDDDKNSHIINRGKNKQRNLIDIDTIANILFFSGGLKKTEKKMTTNFHLFRSQYAVETYLFSLDTELPVGLYHYNPFRHVLDILPLTNKNFVKKGLKVKSNPKMIIMITGVFNRVVSITQDRGYTLLLKEVGYLSQNIVLYSKSYQLETEILEDFIPHHLDNGLKLDSMRETVLEVILIN